MTTLKKKDISIKRKEVTFKYLSKDGVPRKITEKFPAHYVKRLKLLLKKKKPKDFVFTNENGHPIKAEQFMEAFEKYSGKKFYPLIVRSYYATFTAEKFLKKHSKPKKKKEVKKLFLGIAEKLGHKKYSKKKHDWEDSYTVTVNHYIEPRLAGKLRRFL